MRRGKNDTKTEAYEKLKDTLQKLKAENRQLRKKLKTAQKELSRGATFAFDAMVELEDEMSSSFEPLQTKEPTPTLHRCHSCQSTEVDLISAGRYTIHRCNTCGFKKRHNTPLTDEE